MIFCSMVSISNLHPCMIFHCDAGHLIEDGDAVALLRPEHVVVLLARGEPVTVVISVVMRSVLVSTRRCR